MTLTQNGLECSQRCSCRRTQHSMIRGVTESDVERARGFLAAHIETSLFLLSNLAAQGPRLGDALNSGNYRWIEQEGRIVSVFSLTRRGNLLAETGGRSDLADEILCACAEDPIRIDGIVGEWAAASSLWTRLCASPGFQPTYTSKEALYRLVLPTDSLPHSVDGRARRLIASDFERWEPLNTAYLIEEGLPAQGSLEQRRVTFARQAADGHWWGLLDGLRLCAVAGLNARYESMGQVGGVYTVPDERGRGLGRAVMQTLCHDAMTRHQLEKLILFTGERNLPARKLYESLGFSTIGYFGLLFWSWSATGGPDV